MRILVLDDSTDRQHAFKKTFPDADLDSAMNAQEAGQMLQGEPYDVVYLDHDLGTHETGTDVATYIAKYLPKQKQPKKVVVHSINAPGAIRMCNILRDAGVPVTYEPFGQ